MFRSLLPPVVLAALTAMIGSSEPFSFTVETGKIHNEVPLDQLLGGNIATWYTPGQLASGVISKLFSARVTGQQDILPCLP